jgi:hypothetical protein
MHDLVSSCFHADCCALVCICAGLLTAAAAAADTPDLQQQGLVTSADFAASMQRVGPSIVRGAAVEVSPVNWDDVGGYTEVKQRLRQAVEWPLQHAGWWGCWLGLALACSSTCTEQIGKEVVHVYGCAGMFEAAEWFSGYVCSLWD